MRIAHLFFLTSFLFCCLLPYSCTSPSLPPKSEEPRAESGLLDAGRKDKEVREAQPEKVMERVAERSEESKPDRPVPKVSIPISQRLCLANPEVHGTDTLVRSQLDWMGMKLKEAGVKWLRYQLFWHRIEAKKGTFDFSRYERAVTIMAKHGIQLVAVLAYGNPWASSKTTKDPYYPPDDPADFARFVKETVTYFRGRIKKWEIWNEPNAGYRFWKTKPHGGPKEYAELLVAAAKAVKEADPQSQVSFGGPFFHEQIIMGAIPFLKATFEARPELRNLLDRLTAHPYPHYPPVDEPEDGREPRIPIWKMLEDTIQFLPGRPLWITEMGWPSYYKVNKQKQAELLSRSFLLSFASGAEIVCWYKFGDADGKALFPAENLFGLFEVSKDYKQNPPAPKPSYLALRAIYKIAGEATQIEPFQGDWKPGEYALRLVAPGHSVLALWRQSSAPPRTVTLPLPKGKAALVYDVFGKPLRSTPQKESVQVSLKTGTTFVVVK